MQTDIQNILSKIHTIRGIKVMLDRDLASLYHVTTSNLNLAAKRNPNRFPDDFRFQLTKDELQSLRLQFEILEGRGKHPKYLPYAFTEQGVAMLSSVLKSKIAVQINIQIMRTFVEIRRTISAEPEYPLLKQVIKRIESRMDTIEANHLVDHTLISGKLTHLSKVVQDNRQDLETFSKILDQFHETHLIIKRPDEGLNLG